MLTLSQFYTAVFGCKAYKLSLDAGCTCPNRDGTKGTGGCIFCSEAGSGDFAESRSLPVAQQVELAKKRVEAKLQGRSGSRKGVYVAYFQNFTSTYGDTEELLAKYRAALSCKDVSGLAVATRPDCLSDSMLKALSLIAEEYFVQIELGLQTSSEKTGTLINRCYTDNDYCDSLLRIRRASPRIHIVTHLIFGLPGETEAMMLDSLRFVLGHNSGFFGLKITVLYVVRGTVLAGMYERGEVKTMSKDEYLALLKKALALLPERCVVHRLTGDPPKKTLLSPLWTQDKKRVLNEISELTRPYPCPQRVLSDIVAAL
ncbi:MAG: TIGR01212 family radical SAM protein [Treponema sp.]|nr:TIGR01212 family radical SAM protein [Treponema sp.]